MTIIPVILSGGSGTRLWPLSRADYPKQLIPLAGEKTMIQQTIERVQGLNTASPIVVCNEKHRFIIAEQLREIGIEHAPIIIEPVAKNTAPAIVAACIHAEKIDPESVVLVLPSDHCIENTQAFVEAARIAVQEAQTGSLVTFGITPTFAATGYGYIESSSKGTTGTVKRFVEKPDEATAQKYLDSGNFYWNSGMFVFKASSFLDEVKTLCPEIYEATAKSMEKASVDSDFIRLEKDSFTKNPSISIDYAVMEKTKHGKVVPLDAGWNDVGSWESLWEVSKKDADGNVVKGPVVLRNVTGSLIHAHKRTVAAVGVDNLVIVDTPDALLVIKKEASQDVKHIVDTLKEAGNPCATESFMEEKK
ncbi:MAG: mannose-1-phosphate guanylyltransferase/mannose-6-phosphate isomerase [Treponema sp.]|nr:mannose-1-phosphate guanylyltransferase/mannose-6-phosphate isomerase [Treponema sp.]